MFIMLAAGYFFLKDVKEAHGLEVAGAPVFKMTFDEALGSDVALEPVRVEENV
jgi:hypothetical protein